MTKRPTRSDRKASETISDLGWTLREQTGKGRFVAEKIRIEPEDNSETKMYESSFILDELARNVIRRERENAAVGGAA